MGSPARERAEKGKRGNIDGDDVDDDGGRWVSLFCVKTPPRGDGLWHQTKLNIASPTLT